MSGRGMFLAVGAYVLVVVLGLCLAMVAVPVWFGR
jgi:hypothetical protein